MIRRTWPYYLGATVVLTMFLPVLPRHTIVIALVLLGMLLAADLTQTFRRRD